MYITVYGVVSEFIRFIRHKSYWAFFLQVCQANNLSQFSQEICL